MKKDKLKNTEIVSHDKEHVELYTDGSCHSDNKGGYAAYIPLEGKVICGAARDTTNNQMELYAAIEGLKHISNTNSVTVYSDSKYVCDGIGKGWVKNWKKNNWKTSQGSHVKNKELWIELDKQISKKKQVEFCWVKGHSTNTGNNLCDAFANEAISCLNNK